MMPELCFKFEYWQDLDSENSFIFHQSDKKINLTLVFDRAQEMAPSSNKLLSAWLAHIYQLQLQLITSLDDQRPTNNRQPVQVLV